MKAKNQLGAVLVAVLVIVSGSAAALAMAGSSSPSSAPAAQEAQQPSTTVTVENLSAEEIVLEDVEVNDVTVRADETPNEAVQRALAQQERVSVEAVELRDVSEVDAEFEGGTATVSATIGEVHLMGVSVDEASFEVSDGEQAANMRGVVSGLMERVNVGSVTVSGMSVDNITVEAAAEGDDGEAGADEGVTEETTAEETTAAEETDAEETAAEETAAEETAAEETTTAAEDGGDGGADVENEDQSEQSGFGVAVALLALISIPPLAIYRDN